MTLYEVGLRLALALLIGLLLGPRLGAWVEWRRRRLFRPGMLVSVGGHVRKVMRVTRHTITFDRPWP